MHHRFLTTLCLTAGFALAPGLAAAAIPATVVLHGRLLLDGNPVVGDSAMAIRLYDGASGGVPLFEHTGLVPIVEGYFRVRLDLGAQLDAATLAGFDAPHLGISVAGAAELVPRLALDSVPYALAAEHAVTATQLDCQACVTAPMVSFAYAASSSAGGPATGLECQDACVSTSELDNGAVTFPKLTACPPTQVLRSGNAGWECSSALRISDTGSLSGIGIVPIGTVLAWHKSLTGTPALPAGFVECNGQALADPQSPYNGQTIPNLNAGNRFLRGAASSGGSGGATTHTHSFDQNYSLDMAPDASHYSSGSWTLPANHLPPYFDVVWILRVK